MWDNEDATFHVVHNGELQYSIWPTNLPVPDGWKMAETTGTKQECLVVIEERWTDMRPKSLIDATNS